MMTDHLGETICQCGCTWPLAEIHRTIRNLSFTKQTICHYNSALSTLTSSNFSIYYTKILFSVMYTVEMPALSSRTLILTRCTSSELQNPDDHFANWKKLYVYINRRFNKSFHPKFQKSFRKSSWFNFYPSGMLTIPSACTFSCRCFISRPSFLKILCNA